MDFKKAIHLVIESDNLEKDKMLDLLIDLENSLPSHELGLEQAKAYLSEHDLSQSEIREFMLSSLQKAEIDFDNENTERLHDALKSKFLGSES